MRTFALGLMVALLIAGAAYAEAPKLNDIDLLGSVGPYRIGMNLQTRDDTQVIGARYFYASKLKDIPLALSTGVDALTLTEPSGGTFHLHFVGNGSEQGAPLTAYNSIGLAGAWTDGARTLPVKLQMQSVQSDGGSGHRYALITHEPDAAFEARVQRFLHGVLSGDREQAAAAVSYPLHVNSARPMVVRDKAQLMARWDHIFTPAYVAVLRTAVPHDLFVNYRGAMVANGAAWFDDKGATTLNVFFGGASTRPAP